MARKIDKTMRELERMGYEFRSIGTRLHYEFTGESLTGMPVDRIREMLEELGGCVPEVLEHLRNRHRPPARWVARQVTKTVARWPREMWPITLYRQGEPIVFKDIRAVQLRTLPGEIWTEENEFILMLDYSRKLVGQIKALPFGSRCWDPKRRVWAVRQDFRENLDSILLDQYGVSLAEVLGERC